MTSTTDQQKTSSRDKRSIDRRPGPFPQGRTLFGIIGSFLLLSLLSTGCETRVSSVGGERIAASMPVTLTPGDVVKLTFPGAPDLNQSQKIQNDGRINLPMIGQVSAAGKSVSQLQGELSARYKPQLENTEVVVTLDSAVIPVVVSGAVSKPGKLLFDRPTTVFQAIMEAGGVNEFGNMRNVHLIRTANGQQTTQILDLRTTLDGTVTRAVYVRNGDVIYVPESIF
jgi:polysaccharide biosynthesis/export protein